MTVCHEIETPFFQELARPVHFEPVSSRYYRLRLHAPRVAAAGKPGQFVMLACHTDDAGQTDPLLPRPMALLDTDETAGTFDLLFFVHGKGTQLLQQLGSKLQQRGSCESLLRVIGPLGNGFEAIPEVDLHLGVGGGSGVAPLVFFFRALNECVPMHEKHLILAARSKDQLAQRSVIEIADCALHEATDDGSSGFKGHAIAALEVLLLRLSHKRVGVYLAGPDRMMEAGAALAKRLGLPARVSLEARMACGVGVCRACIVDGTSPHPKSGLRRRAICIDGPVFDPLELSGWC